MTINIVRERLNSELEILGILATLYDGRTNMSKNILKEIREYFKEKAFSTVIPMNIKLCEATSCKKTIFDFAPASKASRGYRALADEVWALTQDVGVVLQENPVKEEKAEVV